MKLKALFGAVILCACTFISFSAKAQFGEEGQKVVGLAAQFYTGKENVTNNSVPNTYTNTNYSAQVSLGKFFKKNRLTSASIGYGRSQLYTNNSNNNTQPYQFFNAAVRQTHYYPIAKKFFFGIGGELGAQYGKSTYLLVNRYEENKNTTVGFYIIPSLSYQINKRFVATIQTGNDLLGIEYVHSTQDLTINNIKSSTVRNSFNLNAGVNSSLFNNTFVGFSYLLKNKNKKD